MTDTVVAEGLVKFRDGKKWKTRWVVLRKPSPVADCLSLLVYKGKKKGKASGHKERLNVTLEGICGVEPGPGYDGVSFTLSILCLARVLVLGFNSRDALLAWDAHVRFSLGEVHRFSVNIEPGTKLESGPASLHLCNNLVVLTRGLPPVVIGHWKLSALRRYGAVPNGFVFEGGTRCGYWAGVFFLSSSEGEQISFLFDCIVSGVAPSRGPHGLRPSLPADLSADQASAEQRINQEALELEKRLSMLSQCSLASSSSSSKASTYGGASVTGDDRSSISSSSSNQSDTSYGSQLPFWAEPLARLYVSSETASSSSTLKALASSEDRLYAAVMGGPVAHSSSAQLHLRGLHDSGRQSSLDSGIGIAMGSQSSYSGSCSSCTGSLDAASQGRGEESDSVASQPATSSPLTAPPPSPPPPSSPIQPTIIPDCSAANSPCSTWSFSSRSSSRASGGHSEDYQIPGLLRQRYDTPRSLLHTLNLRDAPALGTPPELGRESRSSGDRGCSTDNYITPEQWRSAKNRCLTQAAKPPSSLAVSPSDTQDARLYVREEYDNSVDVAVKKPPACPTPSVPPPPPITPRPTSASGMFRPPCGAPVSLTLDPGLHSDTMINYINVLPFKPNRELLHSRMDSQDFSSALVSSLHCDVPEEGPLRYAHLNHAAMGTAQRVGAEHDQGRRDRLTQQEDKQRGHHTESND